MCKIAVMSGINSVNRELAWSFAKKMAVHMSSGGDRDGFGYAAMSESGQVFGERWLTNSNAFVSRDGLTQFDRELLNKFGGKEDGLLKKPETYNSFGTLDFDNVTAITLHARMATSGKQFYNTHPFVRDNTTLIHNGVIGNVSELELISSSCDSETILNSYIKHQVMNKPENIQKVANDLNGYYACAMFSKTNEGEYILDVFKDDRATLVAGYVSELGIVVFSTSGDHISRSASELGLTVSAWFGVRSGVLTRINALSGDVMHVEQFVPEYKPKSSKRNKYKPEVMSKNDVHKYEGFRSKYEVSAMSSLSSDDSPYESKLVEYDDHVWEKSGNSWIKRTKVG